MPAASPRPRLLVALAAALALTSLLAACGDDQDVSTGSKPSTTVSSAVKSDGATSTGGTPSWPDDGGKRDGAPTITAPTTPPPTELKIDDLTVGTGEEIKEGDIALVDYTGANYSNGKVFDASYGDSPFPVTVGAGMVIKGWDQGLVGMREGGKRQLVIPPDLAYGDQAQGDIPANETLIFIVEARAVMSKPTIEAVAEPTTKLVTEDLKKGYGDATAKKGDHLSLHYVGADAADGKVFDASWDHGQPIQIELGAGQVIKGWDQGLEGMKLGGRRRLVIPPQLAYGADGRPPVIEPNETLVFVVDLVGIE